MSIFTQNASITPRKSDPLSFRSRSIFPNFCTANKCTIQSEYLCGTDVTSPKQEIYQAQWLTSSLSVSLSTKHYLTNETQMILKLFCVVYSFYIHCVKAFISCVSVANMCRGRCEDFASDCFAFLCCLVILHLVCQGRHTKKKHALFPTVNIAMSRVLHNVFKAKDMGTSLNSRILTVQWQNKLFYGRYSFHVSV